MAGACPRRAACSCAGSGRAKAEQGSDVELAMLAQQDAGALADLPLNICGDVESFLVVEQVGLPRGVGCMKIST